MSAFISLLHTVAAAVAVPLGAFVLFGKKGSFLHKKLGRYYFISMLLANTSSLFIYKAFGEWFFSSQSGCVDASVFISGVWRAP